MAVMLSVDDKPSGLCSGSFLWFILGDGTLKMAFLLFPGGSNALSGGCSAVKVGMLCHGIIELGLEVLVLASDGHTSVSWDIICCQGGMEINP